MTSMTVMFLVALVAVMLVTAGEGLAQGKKAARKAAPKETVTNPCAPKAMQPCAANPCAAKAQPCAVQNPCAAKAKNPCAANPCAPQKK